jgi:hypothetical protein
MDAIPRILERLGELAHAAGGDPPLPDRPDDKPIKELQGLAGNQQFVAVHSKKDDLLAWHKTWSSAADTIRQRLPEWQRVEALRRHAGDLPVAGEVDPQIAAIRANRGLLDTPNPVSPIAARLAAALRTAVNDAHARLRTVHDREVGALEASEEWSRLKPEDPSRLLTSHGLLPVPAPDLGTDEALLASLNAAPLSEWETREIALPARAAKAREEAARLVAPKAVTVRPPAATLKTPDDVNTYVEKLREDLLARLSPDTPVLVV